MKNTETMPDTDFRIEDDRTGLILLSRVIDNIYYCRVLWRHDDYGMFKQERFESYEEALYAAKNSILTEAGKLPMIKIQAIIDTGVTEMKHTLSIRLAELRGMLFSQVQKLKAQSNG